MTLTDQALSVVAIAAAVVAVLALAWTASLAARLRRLRRRAASVRRAAGDTAAPAGGMELDLDLADLRADLSELREAVGHSVQRVGLVRFDAFEDMGGKLSFAAALLDAGGDGIVFSSINGRTETRIYAKPVEGGASRYNLSDEEEEAIARALGAVRS